MLNASAPGGWSVKRLFRNNAILKALRMTLNRFFATIPIGDELLAFAVKQ